MADGYEVTALDRFGDVDLRAVARTATAPSNDGLVALAADVHGRVDAALREHLDRLLLEVLRALGVRYEHAVAVLPRALDDRLREVGEERIGQVGDDEADRAGPPGARGFRAHVLAVAKLFRNAQDMRARFLAERAGTVDRIGRAGERHARRLGDFLQGNPFDHLPPERCILDPRHSC